MYVRCLYVICVPGPPLTPLFCHPLPACHPGFYKAYAGNIKCSKCPPHSFSYGEGATICRCEKGFFRAEKDPPNMACTREYTSKQHLTCYLSIIKSQVLFFSCHFCCYHHPKFQLIHNIFFSFFSHPRATW